MRIHEDLDPDPEPWFRAVISLNLERPTSERTEPEADLERSRLRPVEKDIMNSILR